MTVRAPRADERSAIRAVNEAAFEGSAEADLVEKLHAAGALTAERVALIDGEVVGHIAFSSVTVEHNPRALFVCGLAPMAVLPAHQRRGIGSALVREGLGACRAEGAAAVVVLGHPEYYPRFGFEVSTAYGLRCAYDVPEEVFMALELAPGALPDLQGVVRYHPAFDEV